MLASTTPTPFSPSKPPALPNLAFLPPLLDSDSSAATHSLYSTGEPVPGRCWAEDPDAAATDVIVLARLIRRRRFVT